MVVVSPRVAEPMAKPYAASHVAAVAQSHTDLRLSGEVKEALVDLLLKRLDTLVPELEAQTLEQDPERKTLDDPDRTRLNYNRTRELMIDRVSSIDSVGSAAVQRGIEDLEGLLASVIRRASEAARGERMGTLKARHLEAAGVVSGEADADGGDGEDQLARLASEAPADPLEDALQQGGRRLLSPALLRTMAPRFARAKVSIEALEELVLLWYEHADELEAKLQGSLTGGNPLAIISTLDQVKDLLAMGWLHRVLKLAGERAAEDGRDEVRLNDIVDLDL